MTLPVKLKDVVDEFNEAEKIPYTRDDEIAEASATM